MRSRLLASAFAALIVGSAPAFAWTEPQCTTDNGNPSCITITDLYLNNTKTGRVAFLGVFISQDSTVMTLSHDEWQMPTRHNLSVLMRVDRSRAVRRDASSKDKTITITITAQDLDLLIAGNELVLDLPGGRNTYSLDGSRRAITSLIEAFASFTRKTDPFRAQSASPSRDPSLVS
jgi:hypothetical protein